MLTKEMIAAKVASGPHVHQVNVAAWNGETVCFQELDGLAVAEWDEGNRQRDKDSRYMVDRGTAAEHMIRLCLIEPVKFDSEGKVLPGQARKRMFGDKREDVLAVRNFGAALQEMYLKCLRIQRMTRVDEEEARKNSSTVPEEGSGST